MEELGQHRRTWYLCAGWRLAGDLRRPHGRASRSVALRGAKFVGAARPRWTRRADRGDRRSLRQHRLVAAGMSKQPLDPGTRLFDPGPAAAACLPAERLPAGVPRELPDDAFVVGRRAE